MALTITQVMDGRPCWERLNGERAKAFAAFQHFRDQGPTRTMRATALMLIKTIDKDFDQQEMEEDLAAGKKVKVKHKLSGIKKETTAIGMLHTWATRYAWQERGEFFDRHIDRIRIEQIERDTREMSQRHIEFSTRLITLAKDALGKIETGEINEKGEKIINLTPSEILKFGVEGVKIERMTRVRLGAETGIEEPITPNDVRSNAREELKRRIDAIAEKKRAEKERAEQAEKEKAAEPQIKADSTPEFLPSQLKLVQGG